MGRRKTNVRPYTRKGGVKVKGHKRAIKKGPVLEVTGYEDEWEFEDKMADLNQLLERSKSGYWYVEGRNMGWRNRSGHARVYLGGWRDFYSKLLPDTQLSLEMHKDGRGLKFTIWHHDSPTGEFYTMTPISESNYEKHRYD